MARMIVRWCHLLPCADSLLVLNQHRWGYITKHKAFDPAAKESKLDVALQSPYLQGRQDISPKISNDRTVAFNSINS
jgi:hypothetical protein